MIYSLVWEYRERWRAPLPPDGGESEGFAYVEGRATGAITGRFRGTNASRQRSDGRFLTEARGVILLEGGSVLSVDYRGVGCPYPRSGEPLEDRTKVTIAARHQTMVPEWQHLNDAVCIGVGENRFTTDGTRLALFDVHEVIWEPLSDRPTERPAGGPVTIEDHSFDLNELRRLRAAE
jgi:hypothetical protein